MSKNAVTKWCVIIALAANLGCGDDSKQAPSQVSTLDSGSLDSGDGSNDLGESADTSQPGEDDTGQEPDAGNDAGSEPDLDAGSSGMADAGVDAGPMADPCTDPFITVQNPAATPPYSGTSFVTNDLLTDADPTSFVDLTYSGQGMRTMFDRRVSMFVTLNAYLFDAQFGASKTVEIQVNPEFSRAEAETQARKYATVIGRLPAFLFRDIDTVWIHQGVNPFGGGNRNLLIHIGQGEQYETMGSLEEIFIHEATHTSLDSYHAAAPRWLEAQQADGVAISTYARDNPNREDVSESLGPYLAYRLGGTRISSTERDRIGETMPNRIQYFDCLELSMDILE